MAVLGAGMMGAGIAYVCALAGWVVVLKAVEPVGRVRKVCLLYTSDAADEL